MFFFLQSDYIDKDINCVAYIYDNSHNCLKNEIQRENWSCLQSSCNCQYNCREASALGPAWIASPLFSGQKIRKMLFSFVTVVSSFIISYHVHKLIGLNKEITLSFFF
jgi:hypothetical protein